jgi:ribosomal protein S18 acetylase RimI-like enzyme
MTGFRLARLTAADAPAYRELRLEALRDHPEAFAASFEDEAARPPDWFAARLAAGAVWAGWQGDEPRPAGTAGLFVGEGAKTRHKGVLWGMYVRPGARGTGLAAALVEQVLDHARGVVEEVRLSVVSTNVAAIRFYTRLGFTPFATEPRALKVGGAYHDEVLMLHRLGG